MKRSLLLLVLVAGACGVLLAEEPTTPTITFTQNRLELIEKNLVIGLESNIPTLQASAALVLKEVKGFAPQYDFSQCIIPLMRLVKDDAYDVTVRLAAGLALHELKSARGDFAIARTAKFEDNQRIKRLFTAMAYERGLENNLY
ncbi:MAG TPA: hypothetical protein VI758_10565 [Bacteroidota bacterium]